MEARKEVEKNGNDDADEDARSERKINRDVPALISHIARQSTEREACAASKQKNRADERNEKTEADKRFAEFTHRQRWRALLG